MSSRDIVGRAALDIAGKINGGVVPNKSFVL